jgi:hypothetical protein
MSEASLGVPGCPIGWLFSPGAHAVWELRAADGATVLAEFPTYDAAAAYLRTHDDAATDDDYDYHGPRCLPSGPGDGCRESSVDPGRDLRRGWELAHPGQGLPRWARHLPDQLVNIWRLARLWSRMGGKS